MTPLLIDTNQAAVLLGVARRTVYELRTRPDFPKPIALARRAVRYRVADLERWIAAQAGIVNAPEPERLRVGKAAKRGSAGGLRGGLQTPASVKPRQSRTVAERSGFEPENAPNSNRRQRAGG